MSHCFFFSLPYFFLCHFQATKKLTGGSASRRKVEKVEDKKEEEVKEKVNTNESVFFFDPPHYTVMENVGKFTVTITREGDLTHPVELDFETEDGTANEGSDYEGWHGTIVFHAGEAHKSVSINNKTYIYNYKSKVHFTIHFSII